MIRLFVIFFVGFSFTGLQELSRTEVQYCVLSAIKTDFKEFPFWEKYIINSVHICLLFSAAGDLTLHSVYANWLDCPGMPKVNLKISVFHNQTIFIKCF